MPNTILLLGAGFSYNWNGRLASEVTNDLMSHLQGDDYLLYLLHRENFEDALSMLQGDYPLVPRHRHFSEGEAMHA
jgi:hypothetical protein